MDDRLLIGVGAMAAGLMVGMLLRVLYGGSRRRRLETENRELALRLQRLQERTQRQELARRSREDGLTGLPTAPDFRERLEAEIARARRYERPLGLIVVSFDAVEGGTEEAVADPVAIDAACMAVAKAQADLVREQDTVGRLDECTFALLLPETSPFGTKALADRLRRLLEGLHVEWDAAAALRVRPYVGASATVGGGTDAERMLRVAGEGVQASRSKGGAEVSYASPTRSRIQAPS